MQAARIEYIDDSGYRRPLQGRTGGEPKQPLARGSERAGRASQPCLELATREHCSSCAVIQTQYSLLLDAAAQSLLETAAYAARDDHLISGYPAALLREEPRWGAQLSGTGAQSTAHEAPSVQHGPERAP